MFCLSPPSFHLPLRRSFQFYLDAETVTVLTGAQSNARICEFDCYLAKTFCLPCSVRLPLWQSKHRLHSVSDRFAVLLYALLCLLSTYHCYLPCLYIPPSIRLSLSSCLINWYGSRRKFRVFTSLASFCVLCSVCFPDCHVWSIVVYRVSRSSVVDVEFLSFRHILINQSAYIFPPLSNIFSG